jgi:hypothetical protein
MTRHSTLLAALSAAIGGLIVHALHERAHIRRLEGDIHDLWSEVFGTEEDEPPPGAEEDEAPPANLIVLKGRAA